MKKDKVITGQIVLLALALSAVSCGSRPGDKVIGGIDITDKFLEVTEGEYVSPTLSRLHFNKNRELNQALDESIEIKIQYLSDSQYRLEGPESSSRISSPYKDSTLANEVESFKAECQFRGSGSIKKVKAIPMGYEKDLYDYDISEGLDGVDTKTAEGFIYSMTFELDELGFSGVKTMIEPELRKNLLEKTLEDALVSICEKRVGRQRNNQLSSPLQIESYTEEKIIFGTPFFYNKGEMTDIENRVFVRTRGEQHSKIDISEKFWSSLGGEYYLGNYDRVEEDGKEAYFERKHPFQALVLDPKSKSLSWSQSSDSHCSFTLDFKVSSVFVSFDNRTSETMMLAPEEIKWSFSEGENCSWEVKQLEKFVEQPESYAFGISEESGIESYLQIKIYELETGNTSNFYYFFKKQFFK